MNSKWWRPFVFILLAVACGCGVAQTPTSAALGPGRYVEEIQSSNLDRKFIVDVPKSYDGTKAVPVVVVLHGWTSNAQQAELYTRMAEKAQEEGFIAVFPDGIASGWNAGFIDFTGHKPAIDDVKFVSDVLDWTEKSLNVDQSREFVCGHSNGAFLANLVGSKLSQRVAAIGSVAGTIGVGDKHVPVPDSPVSVILIHGVNDEMVSFAKNSKALLRGVGAMDSAEWWANQDGCNPSPQIYKNQTGNVTTYLFAGGKGNAEVELVAIKNGTHTWPGGYGRDKEGKPVRETGTGVSAADLLWDFFNKHPKGG